MCPLQIMIDTEAISLTFYSVNGNFIHQPLNVETYSIGHDLKSSQFFQKQRICISRVFLNVPHVQI